MRNARSFSGRLALVARLASNGKLAQVLRALQTERFGGVAELIGLIAVQVLCPHVAHQGAQRLVSSRGDDDLLESGERPLGGSLRFIHATR